MDMILNSEQAAQVFKTLQAISETSNFAWFIFNQDDTEKQITVDFSNSNRVVINCHFTNNRVPQRIESYPTLAAFHGDYDLVVKLKLMGFEPEDFA